MKKILSIFITLMLLLSLSACSDGTEEAKKTVTSFMDNFCEFRLKNASQYIENKESYPLIYDDLESALEAMKSSTTQEDVSGISEYYDIYITPLYEKFVEKLSYSISDTEKKDGKFYFTIDLQTINMDNINLEYDPETIITELTEELTADGTITPGMTQEELNEVISAPMMKKTAEYALEALDKAGTVTKKITLVVKKIDDNYLITDEGDLSVLMSTTSLNG